MPLPKEHIYTSEDYWNLPEGERAELIDGQLYAMAPPNPVHQFLISEFTQIIGSYIKSRGGTCLVFPAPFAVNLDSNDKNWVEPDISVICDKSGITSRGYSGVPEFIIEIVSPSSRRNDYWKKTALYLDSGVHEYWIVDPEKKRTTVYRLAEDAAPTIYSFDQAVPVGIYEGLSITIADLLSNSGFM